MSKPTATSIREDYLSRLDAAIGELPHRLATELREGVAEELAGLDLEATLRRIDVLGEPHEIARAAAEAAGGEAGRTVIAGEDPAGGAAGSTSVDAASGAAATAVPVTATRGYAIASAIVLGAGGLLVPIVGWFAGIAMVSYSGFWRTWEKAWAIFAPLLTAAILWIGAVLLAWSSTRSSPPANNIDASNPLMPTQYDLIFSTYALCLVTIALSGAWLLWRLRGRTEPMK